MKVAIQGVLGSFHEIAGRKFFSEYKFDFVPCHSFNDLFDSMQFAQSDVAVLAIENTLAGSIIPNYALLKASGLKVMGEVYLRIEQHLLALSGQSIESIQEVHSHPMAIQQCHQFLDPLRRAGVKLIDSEDTALSAKRLKDYKLGAVAAIASRRAAEVYGLDILKEGIETNKRNYTRFLIISNAKTCQAHLQHKSANKATINFKLPNEEGSLSRVLSVLAYYKMNLSKIQSLPVVGKEWEYMFYADLVFSDYQQYLQALEAIKPLCIDLDIIGEYEKAERPMRNKTNRN